MSGNSLCYRAIACLLLFVVAPASSQTLWELAPYQVEVRLAVHPSLEHHIAGDGLLKNLVGRLQSAWEDRWRVHIAQVNYADVRHWISEQADPEQGDWDKLFVVSVAPANTSIQVQAREYDRHVMQWSDTVTHTIWQESQLRSTIAASIHDVFAPLAELGITAEGEVSLQLRAAALPASQSFVSEGDLYQPIARRNDRQGVPLPDGVNVIPWTHLRVTQAEVVRPKVAVQSGLRNPLARRRRGNVQWFALRIKPRHHQTVLHLRDRSNPDSPLPGYDVHQREFAAEELQLVGTTDQRGELVIPAGNSTPVEWLIFSGRRGLAKLVVVPGQFSQVVAELDNDAQRLRVEGRLRGLQENLVDLVARREVLVVRARAALDEGEIDVADSLVDELRRLPGREQLTREIEQLRNTVQSGNSSTQALANRLFTETLQIVNQMLDSRGQRQLESALADAKRAQRE